LSPDIDSQVQCDRNGAADGFRTIADSETFGKMIFEEKYSEEGIEMVSSVREALLKGKDQYG